MNAFEFAISWIGCPNCQVSFSNNRGCERRVICEHLSVTFFFQFDPEIAGSNAFLYSGVHINKIVNFDMAIKTTFTPRKLVILNRLES